MNGKKYYAGVGSRKTPATVGVIIGRIAKRLKELGYTLRSGGADGADTFFEKFAGDAKEIFLPWKGFNGNNSEFYTPSAEAFEMAKKFHPAYDRLSTAAKKLMARNCHQVLGKDLKTPVEFVVCWTSDGKASGGTGQAIRIAEHMGIPVFNLKNEGAIEELGKFINSLKKL